MTFVLTYILTYLLSLAMMLNSRMTQSIRELSYEVREDTETPATRYSDEVRDDTESRGA